MNGLLLSAATFFHMFLPFLRTITVRRRTFSGLLLSADVPAVDYYCPRTQLTMLLMSADISVADRREA